jgi:hypothetical protein
VTDVADVVEPGCQGRSCSDGTCATCMAVPESAWVAWKKVYEILARKLAGDMRVTLMKVAASGSNGEQNDTCTIDSVSSTVARRAPDD